MKKQNIITFVSLLTLVFSANAVDKYVSDNVDVYLRRGPSSNYAFSGSVKAGDKVVELEKSADGKYTRIQTRNGGSAWIESAKLSENPSYKERFPELEAQLAEYKDKVENAEKHQQDMVKSYVEKLQVSDELVETLQNKNKALEAKSKQLETQLESMLNQVDDKRRDLIVTWFTYGGLVAGGGLILGLILPHIIPRRRNKDRWMR
ncbi:SH3 domain-containing protein [Gilliamella sp. B2923]|uniref:TIGR04211 family SH3 domain-containing protein n=1 Tax=Gilliamella sp. B2923 TaxID=2818005 RepID=UPI00226AE23B|nr:TIGR04211 family SH3 domain-containing protein [Gilliamella sp. B2923]MCX8617104.1 SH3 domain-containing protein [Gilliamella sp. B2923]